MACIGVSTAKLDRYLRLPFLPDVFAAGQRRQDDTQLAKLLTSISVGPTTSLPGCCDEASEALLSRMHRQVQASNSFPHAFNFRTTQQQPLMGPCFRTRFVPFRCLCADRARGRSMGIPALRHQVAASLEPDLNLDKHLLFAPGPVNAAKTLRTAICKEDICHRETDFDALLAGIEHKILSLFQIRKRQRYRAAVITGSGMAAYEAILSSVVGEGAVLILSNGEFGGRLHKTSVIHNKRTHLIEMPRGIAFDIPQIATYLATHKIDVVAMVHHETCSGMLNPLAQIGALAKASGALFMVDGVSSVGAEAIDMEACNIAFMSSSSSKALGSYPGPSFVVGRKKQFKRLKRHTGKTTYLNLATFYAC